VRTKKRRRRRRRRRKTTNRRVSGRVLFARLVLYLSLIYTSSAAHLCELRSSFGLGRERLVSLMSNAKTISIATALALCMLLDS